MGKNAAPDPMDINLFGVPAVMVDTNYIADLAEQLGWI